MGVDYIQNRSCRIKRELGLETLVTLLKSRAQAAILLAHFDARGENPLTATVKRIVQYSGGPVEESVDMADLLEADRKLRPYEAECEGCTANFKAAPFGCCGHLNYPISTAEERWLMARLPDAATSVAGIYLRNTLREMEIDGTLVTHMRSRGKSYFEGPDAIVRRWEGLEQPYTVTSDQMLQFLFYSGGVSPLHAALASLFVGLIPHNIAPDTMQAILRQPELLQDHLEIDAQMLEVLRETQLGMFLLAIMSTALNRETLLIDA